MSSVDSSVSFDLYRQRVLVSGLVFLAACTPTSSTTTGESTTSTPVPTVETASSTSTPAADDRFEDFVSCDAGGAPGAWLCGSIEVPVDRADPGSETIEIKVWARPHTALASEAEEPVFMTPGGPGYPGIQNPGVFWLPRGSLGKTRDFITIDPRGTGSSAALDCQELQNGFEDPTEWAAVVGRCGASLGANSDRYGAADRAMDVEAVREWLGYDQIFYFGVSYGGVDAQAYAARYPERLAAVVLDSSFLLDDSQYTSALGTEYIAGLMAAAVVICGQDPGCTAVTDDPRRSLTRLVDRIVAEPLVGTAQDGTEVTVDETYLLEGAFLDMATLIVAGVAYELENPQPLLDFAAANPPWYRGGYDPDITFFSAGANVAGWCNDNTFPFDRGDPIEVRRQKLNAAIAELPADWYSPWTKDGFGRWQGFDYCIEWPAPTRYEPVVPAESIESTVPALILAGETDLQSPKEGSRRLLEMFPDASFVVVPRVGHPTLAAGQCVADLITVFIDTLEPVSSVVCG